MRKRRVPAGSHSAHEERVVAAAGPGEREERIVELVCAQHGIVTRSQLLEIGLTPSAIRRRLATRRLIRIHRGVFGIGPLLPPHAPLMAAVLACGPDAVLSHRSAAVLFGIAAPSPDADPVDVSIPLPLGRVRPGVRIRRVRRLDPDERTRHEGIPITTPSRTLVDVAVGLQEPELERIVARAEREGLIGRNELETIARRYRRHRAAGRIRAIVQRAGGPSFTRSEAEARFLALVRRSRLPAPRVNVDVAGFEIDFLWPEVNVAVEVDGYRFHASRPSFEADRRRTTRLAALGIQVVPGTRPQGVIPGDRQSAGVETAQRRRSLRQA